MSLIKITDVNQAALDTFGASTKEDLIQKLSQITG
jgi:hypothetical protein